MRDETTLPFPPEMVWRALVDLRSYPLWWPSNIETSVLHLTPGLIGSLLEIRPRSAMRFVCEVKQCEENSALHLEYVEGLYTGTGIWRLEPAGQGTCLSYSVDLGIRNRMVSMLAYILDIPAIHSRLVRHLFEGLNSHLARQPSRPPVPHWAGQMG